MLTQYFNWLTGLAIIGIKALSVEGCQSSVDLFFHLNLFSLHALDFASQHQTWEYLSTLICFVNVFIHTTYH